MRQFLLTLQCPDKIGLVYTVAEYLLSRRCNITDNRQFGDPLTGRFFMRIHFESTRASTNIENLRSGFRDIANEHAMQWRIDDPATRTRTLIMVSRRGHCLTDLLYRVSTGSLNIEVPIIVSNHMDMARLASWYGIRYEHIPTNETSKDESEDRLLKLIEANSIELVVLARYMQVLSDDVCHRLRGKAINIHHSFLPGFKGARPYHQAFDRGVKLIGATAHYITPELDEGPIIEQEVVRVDHTLGANELAAVGQDVESLTLAKAVRWHAEHRVHLNGGRTVVFR
jgi:formyltetrahydrofolate deformylase